MDGLRNSLSGFASSIAQDQIALEIVTGVAICIAILIVYYLIKSIYNKFKGTQTDNPYLYQGLKPGNTGKTILQNPNKSDSITLQRSANEKGGIEFSYSLWMYIDGRTWDINANTWKHVFHKGQTFNSIANKEPHTYCEIQCPGLWIHPENNTLRLYVNTFGVHNEYIEIENLPIKKWVNLTYTQTNFAADIYINGRLKERLELRTLPRQNYANVHMCQEDGFQGFLSNLRYFNYSLSPAKIHDITEQGPDLSVPRTSENDASNIQIANEIPYLSNRWWADELTTSHVSDN